MGVILGFIFSFALAAWGGPPPLGDIITRYESHLPSSPDRLTAAKVKAMLDADPTITSVDILLTRLASNAKYDRLFGSFTLMYASQSLFHPDISPRYPRVIFHRDGFVAAVTGDSSKPSYQKLEMIEYPPETAEFQFHMLSFVGGMKRYEMTAMPPACFDCHGTKKLRPLWGSYPLWPGALGGANDRLSPTERSHLISFADRLENADMSRYRFFMKKASDFNPESANLNLGVHLNFLNFHRMHAALAASEVWKFYSYAVYGAILNCEEIEGFLPAKLRERHEKTLGMSYDRLLESSIRIHEVEVGLRERRFTSLQTQRFPLDNPGFFDRFGIAAIAKLRYVLEGQSVDPGFDMKEWSLSYVPGGYSYNFSNGMSGLRDFVQRELRSGLGGRDSSILAVPIDQVGYLNVEGCRLLRDRSLSALGGLR